MRQNQSYTPGPWELQFEREAVKCSEDHRHDILNGTGKMLGRFTRCGMTDYAESKANARLIAAAPDLLEAILQLVDSAEHPSVRMAKHNRAGFIQAMYAARAAIAKAKGTS